jgi:orotate phosphoribosyltransferase
VTTQAERRAQRANQILTESHAILQQGDHFVYINGDNGEGWIANDEIFPHTDYASELCSLLAAALRPRQSDIVCGPATGGLIVSQWTAHHLHLPSIFAEHAKEHGYDPIDASPGPLRPPFALKRGYARMAAGRRVLIVDDVVNTGESVAETAAAVREAGGEVVTVAALCSRGNASPHDVSCEDFVYVTEVKIPSWPAATCELAGAASQSTPSTRTRPTSSPDVMLADDRRGAVARWDCPPSERRHRRHSVLIRRCCFRAV